jgi:hypothetical protein
MSAAMRVEDLFKPPSDEEVGQVLLRFAKDVHEHYGSGLVGLDFVAFAEKLLSK